MLQGPLINAQKLYMHAATNTHAMASQSTQSNYNKLKNTYIA